MLPIPPGPIICHRISGIGDQLVQLAHGILLGQRNGAPVHADWRRSFFFADADRLRNAFGVVVSHPGARPVEDLLRTTLAAAGARAAGIRQCIEEARYGSTLSEENYREFLRTGFTPPWAIFEVPLNVLPLRADLDPVLAGFEWGADIRTRADRAWDKARTTDVVAIHYRHGNGEFASAKTEASIAAEMDAMIAAARQVATGWQQPRFLVCTDSVLAERHFESRLGAAMFTQSKAFLPPGSGAMHYTQAPDGQPFDRFNMLLESLVDIELMGRCRGLVRDEKSTFSLVSGAKMRRRLGETAPIVEVPTRRIKARFLASYSTLIEAVTERQR